MYYRDIIDDKIEYSGTLNGPEDRTAKLKSQLIHEYEYTEQHNNDGNQ